jgi:hypothetical protein
MLTCDPLKYLGFRASSQFHCFISWHIYVPGDLEYKPYVTAEPDVTALPLNGTEDFLVLACDGLWDFVTDQQAVAAVYQQISKAPGKDASHAKVILRAKPFIIHSAVKFKRHLKSLLQSLEVLPHTRLTVLGFCSLTGYLTILFQL